MIHNHHAARLSELDLAIARSVPPGGNWKNIPVSIPSNRLHQIRESYAAGKGSRSTYYGRLKPELPAYTINTYFTRPGNGCHLHYDYDGGQHRTLSYREAARLQAFPDNFVFYGSQTAIAQQIGNAVPPLLAYQIALSIPFQGQYVDLFSGAGGLSLGFKWAGWQPIVANDIEESFLTTYRANIHDDTICGDIRGSEVFDTLVQRCLAAKERHSGLPLFVLGGPPCQGFSTAGNRRSMTDERNWLFKRYREFLEAVRPDGFVFENVTGLLNMEGGTVFAMVRDTLTTAADNLAIWHLQAEEYAVPQRRTRVVLIGDNRNTIPSTPPPRKTRFGGQPSLFEILPSAIGVQEALSDLPPLQPGQNGSELTYLCEPRHTYQAFMRSLIKPNEYLEALSKAML